jgi:hypothetical protein
MMSQLLRFYAEYAILILILALSGMFFYHIGKALESCRCDDLDASLDEAISELTELRVMREWEAKEAGRNK